MLLITSFQCYLIQRMFILEIVVPVGVTNGDNNGRSIYALFHGVRSVPPLARHVWFENTKIAVISLRLRDGALITSVCHHCGYE